MASHSRRAALPAILLVAALLTSCGSISSDGTSGHGETSASFSSKSKIVRFGKEAPVQEREAASEVLTRSLDARAGRQWAQQCATLDAKVAKAFADRARFYHHGKGCAKGLELEASAAPKSVLADNLSGHIDALRIRGHEAYALFHGADGNDYAMPMKLEDGSWRVAEVKTIPLPSPAGQG